MRQIRFSPDSGWHEGTRWLCHLRFTCADLTSKYGFHFIEDDGLPGKFGALVEIDDQLFLLESVPDAGGPEAFIVVIAHDAIRSPRAALDAVLKAFDCTQEQIEAINDGDLDEWPWMLTRDDGHGCRQLVAYARDEADARRRATWMNRSRPTHDYRAAPAA